MPNLNEFLQPRIAEEQTRKEHEATVAERQRRAEQYAHFERLDRLIKSPDVQWFLKQLEHRVTQEHDTALNVAATLEARNNAAQRHDIAKDMHTYLTREHRVYLTRVEDEKSSGQT